MISPAFNIIVGKVLDHYLKYLPYKHVKITHDLNIVLRLQFQLLNTQQEEEHSTGSGHFSPFHNLDCVHFATQYANSKSIRLLSRFDF